MLSLPLALRYLLATRPEVITQVPGIVYRAISGHLISQAGLTRASAVTGAVTLRQRLGSAFNLNMHFHLLVVDGAYRRDGQGRMVFVPVPAPSTDALKQLVQRIAERVGCALERAGPASRSESLHAANAAGRAERATAGDSVRIVMPSMTRPYTRPPNGCRCNARRRRTAKSDHSGIYTYCVRL